MWQMASLSRERDGFELTHLLHDDKINKGRGAASRRLPSSFFGKYRSNLSGYGRYYLSLVLNEQWSTSLSELSRVLEQK